MRRKIKKSNKKAIEEANNKKANDNLALVREIQKTFPKTVLGGSLALYVQGCNLPRLERSDYEGDIDLIIPYWDDYTFINGFVNSNLKNSGNSFTETYTYNSIPVDLVVIPTQKFKTVSYKGDNYKVSRVEEILSYKTTYAMEKGGEKHSSDILDLLGLGVNVKKIKYV